MGADAPLRAAWFAWAGGAGQTARARRGDLDDLGRRAGHGAPALAVAAGLAAAGPAAAAALVEWWADAMRLEGRAAETIARRVSSARSWISHLRVLRLVDWELVVRRPRVRPYGKRQAASWPAVLAAIEAGPPHVAAILGGLAFLARRRGELLGARLCDVDLEAASIRVTLKGGAELRYGLPERLVRLWRAYEAASRVRRYDPSAPYFRAASGLPLSPRGLHQICRRLGLGSPHRIRHAAAEQLRRLGADLWQVQALLGHANAATTQVYLSAMADTPGLCARVLAGEATFRPPDHTPPPPPPHEVASWIEPPSPPLPDRGSSSSATAPPASTSRPATS